MILLLDGQAIGAEPATIVEWQQVELACTPSPATTLSLQVAGATLEPFLRPGDASWRWRWNPQNGVGLFELLLTAQQGDAPLLQRTFTLRVAPRKIDQDAYTALIADLQQVARELAYAFAGGSEGGTLAEAATAPTPLESYYAFLAGGASHLRTIVAQIAGHPHEVLRAVTFEQALSEADRLDADALTALLWHEADAAPPEALPELQELLQPGGGALPRSLPAQRSLASYDTYENRLLKHVLGELARRLRAYTALVEHERLRLARNAGYVATERGQLTHVDDLLRQCAACAAQIRALRAQPFLAEVAPLRQFHGPSQIMQRDPRYRAVYRLWQELRRRPLLDPASPLLRLPIHELPQLYEVWCALRVTHALLALPDAALVEQRLIALADGENAGLALALPEGEPLLTLQLGDTILLLRYQPRYRPLAGTARKAPSDDPAAGQVAPEMTSALVGSLDRHTRVPDLALELCRPGEVPWLWLLDAKYRLDSGGGLPQQALDDAYTYLGSIGTRAGHKVTQGAYLLYPGHSRSERYASGVGALALLPGESAALRQLLEEMSLSRKPTHDIDD